MPCVHKCFSMLLVFPPLHEITVLQTLHVAPLAAFLVKLSHTLDRFRLWRMRDSAVISPLAPLLSFALAPSCNGVTFCKARGSKALIGELLSIKANDVDGMSQLGTVLNWNLFLIPTPRADRSPEDIPSLRPSFAGHGGVLMTITLRFVVGFAWSVSHWSLLLRGSSHVEFVFIWQRDELLSAEQDGCSTSSVLMVSCWSSSVSSEKPKAKQRERKRERINAVNLP